MVLIWVPVGIIACWLLTLLVGLIPLPGQWKRPWPPTEADRWDYACRKAFPYLYNKDGMRKED
jgi:hypothetical protein